ncbi:MAG: DUF4214 domain-containing protein [Alphaproteobacteria bacterium]|nr:DUF4214 domain-containing protein [Alphaproteobacteria bacterium]
MATSDLAHEPVKPAAEMTLLEATQRVSSRQAELQAESKVADPAALLGMLRELEAIYQEFPELHEAHPPQDWLAPVFTAVLVDCAPAQIAALLRTAGGTASPGGVATGGLMLSLARSAAIQQELVRSLGASNGQVDERADTVDVVLRLLESIGDVPAEDLEPVLRPLLNRDFGPDGSRAAIGPIVQAARARIAPPSGTGGLVSVTVETLMRKAARLRALIPRQPRKSHPALAWPSGRMTFNEFLIQWPCVIQLSPNLDDRLFIEELYRAILLRPPATGEREQYVRLLRRGEISRSWIVEDILSSRETRSLQRHVRVVIGTKVITESEDTAASQIPAVAWPSSGEAQETHGRG